MREQYSLGLQDRDRVDSAFGGGFPTRSLVYVEGEDGAGKSALSQRFTYGMLTEGTTVAYVSAELGAADFIRQMNSLSYDVVRNLLADQLLFLGADLDTHVQEGDRAVGRRPLLSRLEVAKTVWRADVVVIDGLDAILRNDPRFDQSVASETEDHAMQSFLATIEKRVQGDRLVVLTANPHGTTERALRPVRDAADIYLDIETRQVGSELRR